MEEGQIADSPFQVMAEDNDFARDFVSNEASSLSRRYNPPDFDEETELDYEDVPEEDQGALGEGPQAGVEGID